MGYQALLVDRVDGIATVTMNRPEARNALDLTMREEMLGALDEIERDSAVRVMLLTGAGGHFSAGGDVNSMQKKHTAAEGRARVEMLNRFVLRLFNFPKPTIAMVDGFAVGAGCNIALGCDLIVASDRAKFGEVFLENATRALAAKIAAGPPLAATLAKSLLNRAATVDLAAALEGEAFGQSNAITSEDHAEGVRAFLEKRPAKFTGR